MNGHSPRSCLVPPSAQRIAFGAGAALLAGLGPVAAQADDLRSALLAAYNTNPSLQSARETQRATDEGVPIARADGLPSANVTAQDTEYVKQSTILSTTGAQRLGSVSGTLNVPLYSGGAVRNAVKAAEIRVDAGKAGLRGTESTVFSTVVGAYMDVILDEAVVRLNRTEVQTLQVNLQATTDRFQIGDLTRTDVAQSQSRLALAQGNLRGAEANLASAREHYIAVVGKAPVSLEPPPPLPGLPTDADEAVEIALAQNPDLIAARERSRAAKSDVGVAGASRLPRLSLFADSLYGNYFGTLSVIGSGNSGGSLPQSGTTADVGIRATIPLYQGGRPSAEVRQAQAREGAALEDEIGSERSVIDQVRSAFTAWQAANSIIELNANRSRCRYAQPRRRPRRKQRRAAYHPRHPQCDTGTGQRSAAIGHGTAQCLCRRIYPAGSDGQGRGARFGAGWRRIIRPRSALPRRPASDLGLELRPCPGGALDTHR